jgi:malate synthase
VREDKRREASDGFDGTWVAHPDSVSVAMDAFDEVLGDAPNQLSRRRDDVEVSARDLLDVSASPGEVTEGGVRGNVDVGIQYISSWLRGNGAAAIDGLMEDAATAEIARAQVWQWTRHGVALEDGRTVTPALVRELAAAQPDRPARELFERVALGDDFVEFLTLPAYDRLEA